MKIFNKQFSRNFNVLEKTEAGIVLLGSEVKALRLGHADITGAHVKIIGREAYLLNSKIYPYKFSRVEGYDESRTRKLLLHKKEILSLKSKVDQGNFSLIPASLYLKNRNFKVEIALVKGKKEREKRGDERKKAINRTQERELKNIL